MIKELIRSLAQTPNPIIPESLPPPQIYIIHDALTWIERYCRTAQGRYYPPLNPEPYEIPPDIEKRIDESIEVLPLYVFERCVKDFLRVLRRFEPDKEKLLDGLAWALRQGRYSHFYENPVSNDTELHRNPGPQRAPQIEKPKPPIPQTDYALDKPKLVNRVLSAPTKLADKWKLDSRWEKLTPCAIASEYALLRRTYRAETFKKITRAFNEGRTWFPWCKKGVEFLSSKLLYTKKSNPIVKHYKERQIRKGLKQLNELGLISIFYRGYEDQGAGKCFVFLNPKMSSAFHRKSRLYKKGSNPKK